MLNLTQSISFYKGQRQGCSPTWIWVCEWESIGIASVPGGFFLLEAGHAIDARQKAKRILRDGIVKSLRFEFTIRPAASDEIAQFQSVPECAILAMEIPKRVPLPGEKDFVDSSSTDPTSKT